MSTDIITVLKACILYTAEQKNKERTEKEVTQFLVNLM